MKQNNIFKPTLKFSEKTSVSNVNLSTDNLCIAHCFSYIARQSILNCE